MPEQDRLLKVVINLSFEVLDLLDVLVVGKIPQSVVVSLVLVAVTLVSFCVF